MKFFGEIEVFREDTVYTGLSRPNLYIRFQTEETGKRQTRESVDETTTKRKKKDIKNFWR